ncbi:hypothetical protein T492DRAFT_866824 [Pavlovales sp. CCMP2436]|nr:hypothetical protein T492DRAFT_866824 [Pavlovales sp. CCMP2436]
MTGSTERRELGFHAQRKIALMRADDFALEHGTDFTAQPRHSKREARDHCEAAGVSLIEHIEHLEYLEKRWVDLSCASSPLRAHQRARTP